MAIDLNAIKEKLKALSENKSKSNNQMAFWFPDVGEHQIRCLPWPDAQPGQPFHERAIYYFGNNKLVAPSQFGKPDPVKEMRDRLFSTKKDDDKVIAKRLLPKVRAYIPIIVRGKESEGVKIWNVGKEIHARLLGFFVDSEIGDFLDINTGYDLKVKVTKAAGKKYNDTAVDVARKPSQASANKKELDDLMSKLPNINDVYKPKSYDECKRVLEEWINAGAPTDDSVGTMKGGEDDQKDHASGKQKHATTQDASRKKQTSETLDDLENMFKSNS
ncbi:MAG: hypothetical protein E6Q36_02780 [Chryseobacterium sp.]|nr:MAG: hypothetical protein E6Q36_02780 [Chryseobacterium sp.]